VAEAEVLFEVRGRAGVITLNSPATLNAVSLAMVRAMHPQLEAWAGDPAIGHVIIRAVGDKAFSAGGDIRALYEWGRAGDPAFCTFFHDEYRLNTCIKRFPKPYVALIDGIVMGGGVGVSIHGSHRIAGDRMTFAMPETGIGLFPDVGGSFFLPRLPGETGMYLGLTGTRIRSGDATALGVTTHYVPSERHADLFAALCAAKELDTCLAGFAVAAGAGPLAAERAQIDRHFAADSLDGIIASLAGDGGQWAQTALAMLATKSPTSLRITFRQLREGRHLGFEACMRHEYRIAARIFHGHDFFEGIRAVVIDKDLKPAWQPATLSDLSDAEVAGYFAPLPAELPLSSGTS
jgi:enoyl-CoA hydratase